MKILIVEDDPDIRELISFTIASHFDVETIEKESGKQTTTFLAKNNDIDFLITDIDMKYGSGSDLIDIVEKNGLKTSVFVCSGKVERHTGLKQKKCVKIFINKPFIVEPLIAELQKNLGKNHTIRSPYVPVKIRALLKAGRLTNDIYIKLGGEKYVKILKDGDYFNVPDAEHYTTKNIEKLYIKRSELDRYLLNLVKEVTSMQLVKGPKQIEEAFEVSTRALSLIRDISKQVGFSESIQDLTKASATLVAKTIKSEPKLSAIFEKLRSEDKSAYIVDHSVILANVACGIAGLLGWASESTFYKLTLAGFLHDITIKDYELATVNDLDDVLRIGVIEKFSMLQMDEYSKHPITAAEILSQFSNVPQDVDHIIRQHHERPDGTGFPEGMTYKEISPISAVFIFSEHLVNFMIEPQSNGNIETFCALNANYYSVGFFEEVLNAVKKATGNFKGF